MRLSFSTAFQTALNSTKQLEKSHRLTIEDEDGHFILQEHDIETLTQRSNMLLAVGTYRVNADIFEKLPEARDHLHPIVIVSVGSVHEHSHAKAIAARHASTGTPVSLVAIPLDLRNDGFLTDRYTTKNAIGQQALKGQFPTLVLVDLKKINTCARESNRFGVGETSSLLVSARDSIRNHENEQQTAPEKQLEEQVLQLINRWTPNSITCLRRLHCGLVTKGLFMREAGTNLVGAGPDHLIAYALEQHQIPLAAHGARVLLGALIAGALTNGELLSEKSAAAFARFGTKHEFWRPSDIEQLLSMDWRDLLRSAIASRPNRHTGLNNPEQDDLNRMKEQLGAWLEK